MNGSSILAGAEARAVPWAGSDVGPGDGLRASKAAVSGRNVRGRTGVWLLGPVPPPLA